MRAHIPWSWTDSLASLRPDTATVFRVEKIMFGLVRDRCRELDLHEGLELRCRGRDQVHVHVQLSGGEVREIEVPYAWFVQVRPVREAATFLEN